MIIFNNHWQQYSIANTIILTPPVPPNGGDKFPMENEPSLSHHQRQGCRTKEAVKSKLHVNHQFLPQIETPFQFFINFSERRIYFWIWSHTRGAKGSHRWVSEIYVVKETKPRSTTWKPGTLLSISPAPVWKLYRLLLLSIWSLTDFQESPTYKMKFDFFLLICLSIWLLFEPKYLGKIKNDGLSLQYFRFFFIKCHLCEHF